jgi:hypothetical protein
MARLEEAMAQLAVAHKETEQALAAQAKAMAKSREETDERMAKSREETERAMAKSREETERAMAKSREETERAIAAQNRAFDKQLSALSETLNKWIGRFGTDIGTLVELTLIPGIKQKMKKFGHDFEILAPRKQYYRKDGNMLTEVDLFLENGVEVMAVEVKTKFNKPEVEYHVKRLQLLRKHDSERLKGKAILAAIAGLSIDKDAEELASRLGMYVIKMVEDDKNITVIEPTGAIGKW